MVVFGLVSVYWHLENVHTIKFFRQTKRQTTLVGPGPTHTLLGLGFTNAKNAPFCYWFYLLKTKMRKAPLFYWFYRGNQEDHRFGFVIFGGTPFFMGVTRGKSTGHGVIWGELP